MTEGVRVTGRLVIPSSELEFSGIRAQGAGGQHVNKASTAVQLRFDTARSAVLSDDQKRRIAAYADQRVTADGVVVIKAQAHRSQARNRTEAIERLVDLLVTALHEPKTRKPTRPSRRAKQARVDAKSRRGQLKRLRGRVDD